jgi:tryptophanyl-tRNA synthetase
MPGLDGQKMSKSYGNFISLREEDEVIETKIRKMPTDPARVRLHDPGTPELCPVWALHQIYSDEATQEWAYKGCKTGSIGCLECKQPVIDAIKKEVAPMRERARELEKEPDRVRAILVEGAEGAREAARATLEEVRSAMGLTYR